MCRENDRLCDKRLSRSRQRLVFVMCFHGSYSGNKHCRNGQTAHHAKRVVWLLLVTNSRASPAAYFSCTESRDFPQFRFNFQQSVVLGDAFASAHGTGLDLPTAHGYDEVRDESILGFTRAVRNNETPTRFAAQMDGVNGFADRANLVEFNQGRIAGSLSDTARDELGIRDQQIVTNNLDTLAHALRHGGEA